MPWLENLDAAAQRSPRPVYWVYVGLRWCLIFMGAWIFIGLYLERLGIIHL